MKVSSLALRTLFFVGFLIALPVLALPRITKIVDKLLYGDASTVAAPPAVEMPNQHLVEAQFGERSSPAKFEEELVHEPLREAPRTGDNLDTHTATPPPLTPLPAYTLNPPPAAAPAAELDEASLARLSQVRQRLEDLGAQYMVLETTEGARYRFHCQMQIDPRSNSTQPFDSTAVHPLTAAETVLQDVETWRTAALPTTSVAQ